MRTVRRVVSMMLLLALALVVAACGCEEGGGCGGGGGQAPGITDKEIKLGGSYPFSGPASAYAGIAGALFVFASIGFVSPESFPLADSFRFLAAVVVGGLATIWGAVFGGFFMEFLPVFAQDINPDLTNVIFGAVLILFMYLLPHGVMGLLRWIGSRLIEVRPGAAAGAPEAAQPPVGPGDGGPGRSTEETGAPASGMRPAKS